MEDLNQENRSRVLNELEQTETSHVPKISMNSKICRYFIKKKKRYCKLLVRDGNIYCGQHMTENECVSSIELYSMIEYCNDFINRQNIKIWMTLKKGYLVH